MERKSRYISLVALLFLLLTNCRLFAINDAFSLPADDLKCQMAQIIIDADSTIYSSGQDFENVNNVILPYYHNQIKFVFVGITADVHLKKFVEYSTFLENYSDSWTPWSNLREADFVNLREGDYVFKVRAKYSDDVISNVVCYHFTVLPPFQRSKIAYIIYALLLIVLTTTIIFIYKRSFNKEKNSLLSALDERTQGLISANNELETQKESLNKAVKDLSQLGTAGQCIIKNLTIREICLSCYQEINNFFETDNLRIGIFNAIHNSLDFSTFVMNGEKMPFARYNLDIVDNMNVWCFLNGKAVVLDDYKQQIFDYIDKDVYRPETNMCGSAVFIPLFDNDMTVGVLSILNPRTFFFNNYHISIIHNIATYVETAIVNFYFFRKINSQKRLLEDRTNQLEETYNNLKNSQDTLAKVNSELSKLSIAVKNTDNAVSIFDANGDIEWINIGFSKIYGCSLEQYTSKGKNYEQLIKDDFSLQKYRSVYKDCNSISFTRQQLNCRGQQVWLQTTLTPVLNSDCETINQLVVVETDISDLKNAENEIRKQRNEIETKNKDLTKSIEYAYTIQSAIMPSKSFIETFFKKVFILNLPRDIVSGDFFWINRKFGRKYFALVDCAGHGVPGAFVSLMGKMFLDEILHSVKLEDTPATIIRRLNDKLHESVSSLSSKVGGIDGMDLAFCIVNSRNTILHYAGAYRPLYLVRDGQLNKFLPDRCSLGNISKESDFTFTNHEIALQNNDMIFLTSDGYADQFGFENGKKMGRNNFANLIVEGSKLETNLMTDFFHNSHKKWKGKLDQVDDILLTGIRIVFDEDDQDDD